jgi:hypothetical protein
MIPPSMPPVPPPPIVVSAATSPHVPVQLSGPVPAAIPSGVSQPSPTLRQPGLVPFFPPTLPGNLSAGDKLAVLQQFQAQQQASARDVDLPLATFLNELW